MALPPGIAEKNLECYAGQARTLVVRFKDDAGAAIDKSAETYAAEVRKSRASTGDPLATFTVDDTEAATGELTLTLAAADVAVVAAAGECVWDLRESGVAKLTGYVRVLGDVTEPA